MIIGHYPSLVILSATIAILGCFTASVVVSDVTRMSRGEASFRLFMASIALGGSIWATNFVGLLALKAAINLTLSPILSISSAITAFFGTGIALYLLGSSKPETGFRLTVAIFVFGFGIAATQYFGLMAIAGKNLRLSWFLSAICIAVAMQIGVVILWFLFRRRGVAITIVGAFGLGLALSAIHYLAIASAQSLELTLASAPLSPISVSERHLAWAASIMMYLVCSICLCISVLMQFRDEIR